VDEAAAALILQRFLDQARNGVLGDRQPAQ